MRSLNLNASSIIVRSYKLSKILNLSDKWCKNVGFTPKKADLLHRIARRWTSIGESADGGTAERMKQGRIFAFQLLLLRFGTCLMGSLVDEGITL